MQQHFVLRVMHGADKHAVVAVRPGEDASDQTRLAATCSKLADPKMYLCDLANLGQLIEFLSAEEVQHRVLLSIPKRLLQFRNVTPTPIFLA
jgi:predicted ATP-dependent serine protease